MERERSRFLADRNLRESDSLNSVYPDEMPGTREEYWRRRYHRKPPSMKAAKRNGHIQNVRVKKG